MSSKLSKENAFFGIHTCCFLGLRDISSNELICVLQWLEFVSSSQYYGALSI
jgi:hypothetical protein